MMLDKLETAIETEPEKVCPLIITNYQVCDEEKCAWWDGKQCAILSIAKALEHLEHSNRRY